MNLKTFRTRTLRMMKTSPAEKFVAQMNHDGGVIVFTVRDDGTINGSESESWRFGLANPDIQASINWLADGKLAVTQAGITRVYSFLPSENNWVFCPIETPYEGGDYFGSAGDGVTFVNIYCGQNLHRYEFEKKEGMWVHKTKWYVGRATSMSAVDNYGNVFVFCYKNDVKYFDFKHGQTDPTYQMDFGTRIADILHIPLSSHQFHVFAVRFEVTDRIVILKIERNSLGYTPSFTWIRTLEMSPIGTFGLMPNVDGHATFFVAHESGIEFRSVALKGDEQRLEIEDLPSKIEIFDDFNPLAVTSVGHHIIFEVDGELESELVRS